MENKMWSEQQRKNEDFHVAIIMDGNGRWATNQNKLRFLGHQAGAERVREIVETALNMDIDVLSLFAFSSDNWLRPKSEVDFLMHLFGIYLKSEIARCIKNNIRLSIIGRRDRLKTSLVRLIQKAENKTKNGSHLHLRVAIDYSSRERLLTTLKKYVNEMDDNSFQSITDKMDAENVDFLIRTGGEQRLSDFMLWECAYAELYFTKILWPYFSEKDFKEALEEFYNRDRRYGRIPTAIAV
jgi:undecaprenyl diphosphate synthase